jgi:putative flippase GtrA
VNLNHKYLKFSNETVSYTLVSIFAYGLVFGLMIFFVDLLKINHQSSFFLTYLIAYIFDYIATYKLVFKKTHSNKQLLKYILYLLSFLFLVNAIFYFVQYINSHYLIETFVTMIILFPLRFLALRYLVFK